MNYLILMTNTEYLGDGIVKVDSVVYNYAENLETALEVGRELTRRHPDTEIKVLEIGTTYTL
jgi:hypothetical protein